MLARGDKSWDARTQTSTAPGTKAATRTNRLTRGREELRATESWRTELARANLREAGEELRATESRPTEARQTPITQDLAEAEHHWTRKAVVEEDKDVSLDELGNGILGYVIVIKDKGIPSMPNVVHTSREGEDSSLVQTSLPFGVILEPTKRAPYGFKMTRKLKLSLDTSPNVLGVGTFEEDMIMGF